MIQVAFIVLICIGFRMADHLVLPCLLHGIGITIIETVNYIEHYGLQRKSSGDGKYERAMPAHSWNSDHVIGRLMLFELSRHSDHHYLASRKYQVLRHHDDSPQMPTGYPGMMILALVPPALVPDHEQENCAIEVIRTKTSFSFCHDSIAIGILLSGLLLCISNYVRSYLLRLIFIQSRSWDHRL